MTKYKSARLPGETKIYMTRADDGIYYSVGEVDREVERLERLIIEMGEWIGTIVAWSEDIIEVDRTMMDKVHEIIDKHNVVSKDHSDEEFPR